MPPAKMLSEMRWTFTTQIVPDESTRCGCLVLLKTADVNAYGETREELEAKSVVTPYLF